MSTTLYSYSPQPRESVAVEVTEGAGDGCSIRVAGSVTSTATGPATTMSIPGAAVPAVARGILAALYGAIGEAAPIMLPRPAPAGDMTVFRGGYSARCDPGVVTVCIGTDYHRLTPGEAREFAAAIAARADEAESAAETAEVAALTEIARKALLARWDREEEADGVPERVARAILARWTLTEREAGK